TAAETGHLVLATLHTRGAAQAVERLVDSFPAPEKAPVRNQQASWLTGYGSKQPELGRTGRRVDAAECTSTNSTVWSVNRTSRNSTHCRVGGKKGRGGGGG
ncbi:ATPase, T2SS/T4P/T4SS family, partial [Escherichia coli]|uniref:ATPase, T2SS/T4P/T4SS family n=1 Tax=Escherichia coli TaxID=562 RepID=UPI0035DFF3B7